MFPHLEVSTASGTTVFTSPLSLLTVSSCLAFSFDRMSSMVLPFGRLSTSDAIWLDLLYTFSKFPGPHVYGGSQEGRCSLPPTARPRRADLPGEGEASPSVPAGMAAKTPRYRPVMRLVETKPGDR